MEKLCVPIALGGIHIRCVHICWLWLKREVVHPYLRWLTIKGPQEMNLTSLVTCDSGMGVGRKGLSYAQQEEKVVEIQRIHRPQQLSIG